MDEKRARPHGDAEAGAGHPQQQPSAEPSSAAAAADEALLDAAMQYIRGHVPGAIGAVVSQEVRQYFLAKMVPDFRDDEKREGELERHALKFIVRLGIMPDSAADPEVGLAAHLRAEAQAVQCFANAATVAYELEASDHGTVRVLVPDVRGAAGVEDTLRRRNVPVATRSETLVKAMASEVTVERELGEPSRSGSGKGRATIVLRGESGSGKTHNAVAVARALNGTCLYVLPPMLDETLVKGVRVAAKLAQGLPISDAKRTELNAALDAAGRASVGAAAPRTAKQQRDELAAAMVLRCVEQAVPERYRRTPHPGDARAKCLVIVFDEMGDEPEIVRALCSVCFSDGELRGRVAELVKLQPKNVHVIVTGTGVEAHQHVDPGSHDKTYHLLLAAPRAWDALRERVARPIRDALAAPTTPALAGARMMLEDNARLAALFAAIAPAEGSATAMLAGVPHALIAACLQLAVARFRSLNGLQNLKAGEAVADALVNALCAQTTAEPDAEERVRTLCTTYGLVVDHARRIKDRYAGSGIPEGFELLHGDVAVPRGSVRFVAGSAVGAMAHALLFGAGVLGTGEGFEVLAAEFVAFAALFSSASARFDAARVTAMTPPQPEEMPAGWQPPVALVGCLQGTAARTRREPVWMARCPQQLLASTTAAEDTGERAARVLRGTTVSSHPSAVPNAYDALRAQREAVVLVNGASSPYADVIASLASGGGGDGGERRLVLCQCKLYQSEPLTGSDVFAELLKMGHRSLGTEVAAAVRAVGELDAAARSRVLTLLGDGELLLTKRGKPAKKYSEAKHLAALLERPVADLEWWLAALKQDEAAAAALEARLRRAAPAVAMTSALAAVARGCELTGARDAVGGGGESASGSEAAEGTASGSEAADGAAAARTAEPLFVIMAHGAAPAPISPALIPRNVLLLWAPLVASHGLRTANATSEEAAREHAVQRLRGYYPVPFPESPPHVGVSFAVRGAPLASLASPRARDGTDV